MHLTAALKHQSHRYPKRQGRLVISDLAQGLLGQSNSLYCKLGHSVQVAAPGLMRWTWSICHILVTHFGENTHDSNVLQSERETRHGDVVSFPCYESYSYQGSTQSLNTSRAQRWFIRDSGCLPFQEPQNPGDSWGPAPPWGFVPHWKVSQRIAVEEWAMIWF